MASRIFGVHAERILSVLLFLSVLAYVNALLLSNPRVMYAMSEDGILPSAFRRQNAKGALPLALTVFSVLAIISVFWAKEFDRLLSFTIFLDCFGMVLSAGSIFILRKRTRELNGTGIYQMRIFPWLTLVFMAAYSFVAISIALDYRNNNYAAFVGISVMAFFMLVYFLTKGLRSQHE